jgi:hypothetical protein
MGIISLPPAAKNHGVLYWFKKVNGPFGQSSKYHRLEFLPRLARKESNVPDIKST